MTWQALSEARPRAGQAVKYRLRPNGVEVQATYDPKHPAWILEDGHQQTARGHHQWIPVETPAPKPARPAPKVCKEPGCDQPVLARGQCKRHYHRNYKRRRKAAVAAETKPPVITPPQKRKAPKQPPRAPRKPQAPVREWNETSKRSPTRGEFDPDSKPPSPGGPNPCAGRHETIRMQTLGEPCPTHPTERINAWGKCPACVTGDNWAQRQRLVTARPSPEGGR